MTLSILGGIHYGSTRGWSLAHVTFPAPTGGPGPRTSRVIRGVRGQEDTISRKMRGRTSPRPLWLMRRWARGSPSVAHHLLLSCPQPLDELMSIGAASHLRRRSLASVRQVVGLRQEPADAAGNPRQHVEGGHEASIVELHVRAHKLGSVSATPRARGGGTRVRPGTAAISDSRNGSTNGGTATARPCGGVADEILRPLPGPWALPRILATPISGGQRLVTRTTTCPGRGREDDGSSPSA